MQLDILTPDNKVFTGEVTSSTFPGANGEFQVLNNHAPLISALSSGTLKYISEGKEEKVTITGGLVEVLHNKIIVLADGIEE